jgi:hypothetical protein
MGLSGLLLYLPLTGAAAAFLLRLAGDCGRFGSGQATPDVSLNGLRLGIDIDSLL